MQFLTNSKYAQKGIGASYTFETKISGANTISGLDQDKIESLRKTLDNFLNKSRISDKTAEDFNSLMEQYSKATASAKQTEPKKESDAKAEPKNEEPKAGQQKATKAKAKMAEPKMQESKETTLALTPLAEAIKHGDDSFILLGNGKKLVTDISKNVEILKIQGCSESEINAYVSKIVVNLLNSGKSLDFSVDEAMDLMDKFNLYLEEPKVEKSRFPKLISGFKKYGLPVLGTTLFCTLLGASFTWAGTLAGDNGMVTADLAGNILSTALNGATIGAVVSSAAVVGTVFGTRNKLAKKYGRKNKDNLYTLMNGKYKTIDGEEKLFELNVDDLATIDEQIEQLGLPICDMLNKIQNTRLSLMEQEKTKNPFKKFKNYVRRKNNRNREHELEHFVDDLKEKYADPNTTEEERKKIKALTVHIVKHVEECFEDNLKHVLEKKADGATDKKVNLVRDMDILAKVVDIATDDTKVEGKNKTEVAVARKTDIVREMSKHYTLKVLCGDNYKKEIGSTLTINEEETNVDDNTVERRMLIELTKLKKTKREEQKAEEEKARLESEQKAKEEAKKKADAQAKRKATLEAKKKKAEEEKARLEAEQEAEKSKQEEKANSKSKKTAKPQNVTVAEDAVENPDKPVVITKVLNKTADENANFVAMEEEKRAKEQKEAEEAEKLRLEQEKSAKELEKLQQEKAEREAKEKAEAEFQAVLDSKDISKAKEYIKTHELTSEQKFSMNQVFPTLQKRERIDILTAPTEEFIAYFKTPTGKMSSKSLENVLKDAGLKKVLNENIQTRINEAPSDDVKQQLKQITDALVEKSKQFRSMGYDGLNAFGGQSNVKPRAATRKRTTANSNETTAEQ